MSEKLKFEEDLKNVTLKYADKLNAGDIVDSILSYAVVLACIKASQTNELNLVERDLTNIVSENVRKSSDFLGEFK